MHCPSSRGGTKSVEVVGGCEETDLEGPDDAGVEEDDCGITDEKEGTDLEGPDDNEVTEEVAAVTVEKEDTVSLEAPEANDDTKVDFEDAALQIVSSPFINAGPSSRGGGSCRLGVGVGV